MKIRRLFFFQIRLLIDAQNFCSNYSQGRCHILTIGADSKGKFRLYASTIEATWVLIEFSCGKIVIFAVFI